MSDYVIDGNILTDIAGLIREKTFQSGKIIPENMADEMGKIVAIEKGEIILDEDEGNVRVSHKLAKTPTFSIVLSEDAPAEPSNYVGYILSAIYVKAHYIHNGNEVKSYVLDVYGNSSGTGFVNSSSTYTEEKCTDSSFTIVTGPNKLKAGVKYRWICGCIEEMRNE